MIHSKACFKCGIVKSLDEFYKHPHMSDGRVNKCKECNKKDVIENRLKNLDYYREYDRERARLPERVKLNVEVTRAWRADDLRRQRCHSMVSRAIKSGEIVRMSCERCGGVKSLAHHEDYDKPLDVMWLCQACHKQRHKEIGVENANCTWSGGGTRSAGFGFFSDD